MTLTVRVGEFVRAVGTTVDTVRHYEEAGLIRPERHNQHKHYRDADVQAFEAIQELKSVGFTIEDVRLIFRLKESYGCGSPDLVDEVAQQFRRHIEALTGQIAVLEGRRDKLTELLDELSRVTSP